ncbi:MAG TPA: type ISP restriction/modification enzyme, partial [Sphingomicrobium sp.]|nr:type ISP restriction/modification enzyme [Sphingomicrobium sp.]
EGREGGATAQQSPQENLSAADAAGPHPIPPHEGEGSLGRVHINAGQYFDRMPKLAWEFYIGGYQPAQKWLKDRRGRPLSFEDITHYQRIVKILTETDRIMKEIELPLD